MKNGKESPSEKSAQKGRDIADKNKSRPRPESPSLSLIAKYGKLGNTFQKFHDGIKHLHLSQTGKSRPRRRQILPIDSTQEVTSSPYQVQKESKVEKHENILYTPPRPKKLNWKALSVDLAQDATFSQKRFRRRKQNLKEEKFYKL